MTKCWQLLLLFVNMIPAILLPKSQVKEDIEPHGHKWLLANE